MHAVFLDEFGHPEEYDPNAAGGSYHPVFGYGGFTIPAGNLASFSTQFFDMKMHYAWIRAIQGLVELPRPTDEQKARLRLLRKLKKHEFVRDKELRHYVATNEIKGEEAFSRRYVSKQLMLEQKGDKNARKRLARFFRAAREFIELIHDHEGEIVFFGAEKRCYNRGEFANPHIKLLSTVLPRSTKIANKYKSAICIFFDHHQVDEPNERDLRGAKSLPTGPRPTRAREIVLTERLYNMITEPVISLKSNESQCIQAADWVCHFLSQTLPYVCHRQNWKKYKEFHDAMYDTLFRNVSGASYFRRLQSRNESWFRQIEMSFGVPQPDPELWWRPYHRP